MCRVPGCSLAYTASHNALAAGIFSPTISDIRRYAPRRYPHASPLSNHWKTLFVPRDAPSTCSSQSASVRVTKSNQSASSRSIAATSLDPSSKNSEESSGRVLNP